jgi:polyphenol oxidase
MSPITLITASWPAAANVRAVTSTRANGVSAGPYASLNLGAHVGDDAEAVQQNRALLGNALMLPAAPVWLNQVHGVDVVDAAEARAGVTADGAYTNRKGVVCAVLTADCLPIFLCDRAGTEVALLHAGWRGLAAGIVEAGLARFRASPDELLAWLGPAIGPRAFEVGDDVRTAFLQWNASTEAAFVRNPRERWMADIYRLARLRLNAAGVAAVQSGEYCTASQPDLFYSYRRDGATGRLASLAWLE